MKKVAYIIPGYGGSFVANKTYAKLSNLFLERNIESIPVPISWYSSTPEKFSDYTNDFLKMYKRPRNAKVIVLGFSFGAVIAYLTAAKIKPDVLILCSVSPYFLEDFETMTKADTRWWKKTFTESDFSFNKIAKRIKAETYIIVGDKEPLSCIDRSKSAKKQIQKSHFVFAKDSGHNISAKGYLEAIAKIISKL